METPGVVRLAPKVHAAWTQSWFDGDPALTELFGPAPGLEALELAARAVDDQRRLGSPPDLLAEDGSGGGGAARDWTADLWEDSVGPPPEDALVVLAGQQPVLAGGALLVAHKAATAIALAAELTEAWQRPVVPVFLIATEDHDTSEVDHLDYFDESIGSIRRIRAALSPKHEAFFRSSWRTEDVESAIGTLTDDKFSLIGYNDQLNASDHVVALMRAAFGPLGLRFVEAHRLQPAGQAILASALSAPAPLGDCLSRGARTLAGVDLRPSFDPEDPRPLVLESREGRRRRIEADDNSAADRQRTSPADFSPHASLRPIVQAAALPVVAQVCGPSEIVYLAQARGLHDHFCVAAPVLVPRMEATRLPQGASLEALDDIGPPGTAAELAQALEDFERSTESFRSAVEQVDPGLAGKLQRWSGSATRSARRLASAPAWRGRHSNGAPAFLRPRGRYQDMILSWVAEAWRLDDPAGWGRHITSLSRPLEPPRHVVHCYPPELTDG